ncbi:MAG TPA: hypothetical protein PKD51_14110 [Saprospiraceae bacterium]|nr:hypothetical protein [Saprospiraceae bacterium]
MKNVIKIHTDNLNVYATIQIKASIIGIRVLSFLIAIELIILMTVLIQIKADEILSMTIPLILILFIFIGLPIKYLLWNKYGQEFLIVNKKSVSWSYDYGIIKTNLNIEVYDKLSIGYEKVMTIDNEENGRLIFYNYNNENDLPMIIHQTTALLAKSDIELLNDKILELFSSEFNEESRFLPFSNN